jgi:hypothetical protein
VSIAPGLGWSQEHMVMGSSNPPYLLTVDCYNWKSGGLMPKQHYIMACDDRGTNNWPSSSKTWSFGGFIIAADQQERLLSVWNKIKEALCGRSDCELKWKHFFEDIKNKTRDNPLKSIDALSNRIGILWAISQLFEAANIVPVTVLIRKDNASLALFRSSKKGKQVLKTDIFWMGLIAQFSLFLKQHDGQGEIWLDKSGSPAEDERKQQSWLESRSSPTLKDRYTMIEPQIKFFDSQDNTMIQIADFVSGALWAASENDDVYLMLHLEGFFPLGTNSYTLAKVV